eukprot:TRINITY_DN108983_c0_g1_i1.p1 TRINITY_DN108983_c0_g1~~TRINITY_DN108983_c0_g1_i1.p1  ORF type:complete len:823 (+),score=205.32 TRINITY_DN108983_c0_g1_i1:87-2555(+)
MAGSWGMIPLCLVLALSLSSITDAHTVRGASKTHRHKKVQQLSVLDDQGLLPNEASLKDDSGLTGLDMETSDLFSEADSFLGGDTILSQEASENKKTKKQKTKRKVVKKVIKVIKKKKLRPDEKKEEEKKKLSKPDVTKKTESKKKEKDAKEDKKLAEAEKDLDDEVQKAEREEKIAKEEEKADEKEIEEAEKDEEDEEKKIEEEKSQTGRKSHDEAFEKEDMKSLEIKVKRMDVRGLQEGVQKEMNSPALARLLGKVSLDLFSLRSKMDDMDKRLKGGVKILPADPDETLIYPVSVCMRCIMMLTFQYFLIYTAIAACRAIVDLFDLEEGSKVERALKAAGDTVFYAPMLCVLFIGAQMRALQITQGKGSPQEAAEVAMQMCTWSVAVQTLTVFALPLFTGVMPDVRKEGSIEIPDIGSPALAGLLTLTRYLAMLALYAGFITVCICVVMMDAKSLGAKPVDLWDKHSTAAVEYAPPVSVAMKCTMTLTNVFFFIQLAQAIVSSCRQLSRGPTSFHGWEKCMKTCADSLSLAPMLCTLFMSARMRALQLDQKQGKPQDWAEVCFYACAAGICMNAALVIIDQLRSGSGMETLEVGGSSTDVTVIGRACCVAVTYLTAAAIIVSIIVLEAPKGKRTPDLSPTMKCVFMQLTMFLGVYLGKCVSQFMGLQENLKACKVLEQTVKLCPMLAILFVGTRMRALQLSKQQGSPQCWAQDAMYLATGAVFVQLASAFAMTSMVKDVEIDEAGSPVAKKINYMPGKVLLESIKAFTFIALFGSVAAVMVSTLVVRPETAGCEARGFHALGFKKIIDVPEVPSQILPTF